MVWLPRARADVVKVATPTALSAAVPRTDVPSRKVMVPVGAGPTPGSARVAVKVTLWPTTDGFTLEVRVIVLTASGRMTSLIVLVAGAKFWVPL